MKIKELAVDFWGASTVKDISAENPGILSVDTWRLVTNTISVEWTKGGFAN